VRAERRERRPPPASLHEGYQHGPRRGARSAERKLLREAVPHEGQRERAGLRTPLRRAPSPTPPARRDLGGRRAGHDRGPVGGRSRRRRPGLRSCAAKRSSMSVPVNTTAALPGSPAAAPVRACRRRGRTAARRLHSRARCGPTAAVRGPRRGKLPGPAARPAAAWAVAQHQQSRARAGARRPPRAGRARPGGPAVATHRRPAWSPRSAPG